MRTYKRGAGRVRPRRGRAALGRRRQGVPRLPRRDLGLLGRPLPPGRGRGGARAGRPADARLQPLLHRADGAAGRAALGVEPRRPRLLLQLRHRGQRVRDQDRPQARPRPRHRGAGDRQLRARLPRPHLRRPLGDARRWPRNEALGPMLPGFRSVPRNDADGAARGGRREHRRGPDRADPGRGRDLPDRRRGAARRPRGLRRGRRAADLRRDPDRDRADRLALGLRADPGPARRADQRQGARRRHADRRLRHRRRRPARCSSPATTARPSPAARSPPRRRWRCSTIVDDPALLRGVRELGAELRERPAGARRRRARSAAAA